MGGVFGVVSKHDCVMDIFFGTDYHSHLGTKRGGMCVYDVKKGFDRAIHNIENSPFRTKFETEIGKMVGNMGIGSLSDGEPQPLTIYSKQGHYSIGTVGRINNKAELVQELIDNGAHQFMSQSGGDINNTELVAALISTGTSLVDGIQRAQKMILGSMTILVLTSYGIYAARDLLGRTPLVIGQREDGYCVASESFSFANLGFEPCKELGPGEIVLMKPEGLETVREPGEKMKVCTFLWTYFGYPPTVYEGKTVEAARYRNGAAIARKDDAGLKEEVDYVAGVPDSGIPHALGYAQESGIPYARPLIKYTVTWPRSFMPQNQKARNLIAKMKLIPVPEVIQGKKFVLVDDSIVRGTQLRETVTYLKDHGADTIHVRSACPPIMYGCKYLNFSRSVSDMDLISRRVIAELEGGEVTEEILQEYVDCSTERHANMVERIREIMQFDSLRFSELEDCLDAVGIDRCKLCTYCWDGKE
ncbi:MAG: amidophosphoribosyltransferase [Firmicutes bacterium]|nr:amidophosphoribosyltransferase [Bacillota bacterium]